MGYKFILEFDYGRIILKVFNTEFVFVIELKKRLGMNLVKDKSLWISLSSAKIDYALQRFKSLIIIW